MKKIENKLILFLAALAPITVGAQEVTFAVNGGIQGLDFKINEGSNSLKAGGKVGIGYTYFINQNWGIISGAELGYYKNNIRLHNTTYGSYQFDSENDLFEYRIKTNGFNEKSNFYTVSIPILLQYHTTGNTQFYINGGARVYFPFSQKSKITIDEVTTTGYYPDFNVLFSDMPQHGFSTTNDLSSHTNTKLKTTIGLSLETGMSFKLNEKLRLYTGLYADYGLNNMLKKEDSATGTDISLINYNTNNEINSTLKVTNSVDKAKLLGYGLQVKLGFNTGIAHKKHTTPISMEEEIIEEEVIEEVVVVEEVAVVEKVAEPIIKTINMTQIEIVEKPIYFEKIGDKKLSKSDENHLKEVITILTEFPNQKIEITGHTCNIGTPVQNNKVGLERAKAIASYLEENGINASQIEIKSVGNSQPIVPNNTEDNRKKNRRAIIQLID